MASLEQQLLQRYPVISDQVSKQDIELILRELCRTLDKKVPGDIVELGCYIGTTSVFIRRVLDEYKQSDERPFHAYDSFEGLPPKHSADQSVVGDAFKAGELAVSKKQFMQVFQKAGLRAPVVHKGWFGDLTDADVPDQIAFAFLDGDFYESIRDSLHLVWPHMAPGGAILVDDYRREALPGATKAVDEFLRGKTYRSLRAQQNIAIIEL